MATKRKFIEYPRARTPKGIAVFPHLNKPDTQFKAEGEYKVRLRVADADAEKQVAQIEAMLAGLRDGKPEVMALLSDEYLRNREKALASKKGLTQGSEVVTVATDADGNEMPGYSFMVIKATASWVDKKTGETKHRIVPIVDAKRQPTEVEIWGGSEIIVSYELRPWVNVKNEYGVKLGLRAVQIIKLRTKGSGDASSEFDDEEGYEDEAPAKAVAPVREPALVGADEDSDPDF